MQRARQAHHKIKFGIVAPVGRHGVEELLPIFLLSWLPGASAASFHLAFWPGLILGVLRAIETFVRRFRRALPDAIFGHLHHRWLANADPRDAS